MAIAKGTAGTFLVLTMLALSACGSGGGYVYYGTPMEVRRIATTYSP